MSGGNSAGSGFSADWCIRSYRIAQKLQDRGEWPTYMASRELPWLTKALESQELWNKFITPSTEQWRLRSAPGFDIEPAGSNGVARSETSNGSSRGKRSAPQDDEDNEVGGASGNSSTSTSSSGVRRRRAEKRARTETMASLELDDDEDEILSGLSGSDIDMGIWSNRESPEPATRNMAAAEKSLVCATAALHARAAIFEHYATIACAVGVPECHQCTDVATARADVETAEAPLEKDQPTSSAATMAATAAAAEPLTSRNIDEDEDYDDDDDGDNNNAKETVVKAEPEPSQATAEADPKVKKETTDSDKQERRIVVRSVFYTLDELEDVAQAQADHAAQVAQIQEIASQRAAEPQDMLAAKIGAMQNMKNLAHFIDRHRDSVRMSTRELSSLLSEVRPRRSKWANERRVGQVELYEALDHALQELRTMGEAALPFLQQVKRKDAPDYYKVIRNPMDLGAMAKNLRNETYDNKHQFAAHLQLIRDNCYAYNTEPGNYYRRSADALLARSRSLMDAVPDIVVRDAGDVQTECGDDSGSESQNGPPFPGGGSDGQREPSVVPDDATPAPDGSAEPDGAIAPEPAVPPLSAVELNILRATSAGTVGQLTVAELTAGMEKGLGERFWRSKAGEHVSDWLQGMDAVGSVDIAERHVVLRTADGMRQFLRSTHEVAVTADSAALEAIERLSDTTRLCTVHVQPPGAGASEARRRNEQLDAAREEWLELAAREQAERWRFVPQCELRAGISQLESLEHQVAKHGVVRWLNDDCEHPVTSDTPEAVSMEAYAAARFPDNQMWRTMADSIEHLRTIRQTDSKIWTAKLNIPAGNLPPAANEPDEPCSIRDIHGDFPHHPDPPTPLVVNSHGARRLLQRTSAFMLSHIGFEGATSAAMACLADFLADYIGNLGRTLRVYSDKHGGRSMSTEAIVAHALFANGTQDLADLEYYARGSIARYGNKLSDLNKKLAKSYQDTVSQGIGTAPGDEDAAELDRGDAYVTGTVGGLGGLGDDFFGFKELGLDKELGLEQLSVPQSLWHGKSAAQADANAQQQQQEQEEVLAHPLPRPWAPIVSPKGQIGLFRRFICEKLKAVNGVSPPGYESDGEDAKPAAQQAPDKWEPIPEDENLPLKQRYGTGRPKAPAPNYLTHPRTHMHVGSGQAPPPAAASQRAGKKRPAKSTKKKPAS
ncbi:Transcriptional activator spt7 [Coemansia sp. RSA 552]|nr:Transcriptional activator spt7 [Coemansia sp. RSA 552]